MMNVTQRTSLWTLVSLLFAASSTATGQCNPPSSLWLHSTQMSSSFTLNWTAAAGASQYQIRYWQNSAPDDKTVVDDFGPAPATLSGLRKNTQYSLQIRSKCGNSFSNWSTAVSYLTAASGSSCGVPGGLALSAGGSNITVNWTTSGNHCIRYRAGTSGDWLIPAGALSLASAPFVLSNLAPGNYEVQLKQNCSATASDFIGASASILETAVSCLPNKDFGKNLSPQQILEVNSDFNVPSPFTFSDMIGVNDGGLVFRSFQNVSSNQITRLTTQYRNFHTMDEDFDASLGNYASNIKPKDTSPEGTPANTAHNKNFYNIYRNTHGFSNITGATELLHYGPQSWKDKMYRESDWSAAGPAGIKNAFENYTKKFIDEFAPPNGNSAQLLVSNFQVGNELWDYPVKSDYHSLLAGARNAFNSKYGFKSAGGWKMKLIVGAFQAFRDNNCADMLRDVSNCSASLQRHDFIGDYLNVADCAILKDLDAVDCHPYSFLPGTTTWTYPENPVSESWQIRNLAAWLYANKNSSTGVLNQTRLWSTEYGFDSHPTSGVGEQTQAAYLIRGLLMHSRFHFEKVFFYNAYDQARSTDGAYAGLYYSSGFWKLGTHPNNSAWPSPLPEHGALPKPSWFAMLDLKTRFGSHVFYKALLEDADANAWILARPDGSEPYLLLWSPQQTDDNNLNQDITVQKNIDWSGVLSGNHKAESVLGQHFSKDDQAGSTFNAAAASACGSIQITKLRRNPAFIRLVACSNCSNINSAGSIVDPNPASGSSPFDPGVISNDFEASGGSGGSIQYQWQQSPYNNNFTDISGANDLSYDPPALTQSTFFRRSAKRSTCNDYLHSPSVVLIVTGGCPTVLSFLRRPNTSNNCNSADFFYELQVNNIASSQQITLAGLPLNGLSTSLSNLNGIPFNAATFNTNLQYVNSSSFRWLLHPANGATQTLRLYYCWANSYPNPVALTTAQAQCSGVTTPCSSAPTLVENGSEARGQRFPELSGEPFRFTARSEAGAEQLVLTYFGEAAPQGDLRILSTSGQLLRSRRLTELENRQQWEIPTGELPKGLYFLHLQVKDEVKQQIWGKM